MKKIIIMIILAGVLSCSKKNVFTEVKNEMESIVTETSKIYEAIDKEQEELPEIDTSKIKELNNKFKEKYKNVNMEASTQYEQVCREATASFGGRVDGFLKMYQERLEAKKNPKLTKTLNLIYAKTNLRINLEDQKNFFKVCELAANEKK